MSDVAQRLEMLLVLRWLDAGADDDGEVVVSVAQAAEALDLGTERQDMLEIMGALGELEELKIIEVSWPGGQTPDVRVRLSAELRRDAERLFGR